MLEATDIPISLLVAENDTTCPASFVPSIMDSLGATNKSVQYIEDFDHLSFVTANSDEYMQRILSTIETGDFGTEEEGDGEDAEDAENGEDDSESDEESEEDDSDSDEEAVEVEVITADDDWGECDAAHTLYLSAALIISAILAY